MVGRDELRAAFLGALGDGDRARCDDAALDGRLAALVTRARAAWPALAVEPRDFVVHVARHLREGSDGAALDALFAADLYLACGCMLGNGAALAAFEKAHVVAIDHILSRMRLDADVLSEAKQQVRDKLLVGSPPKIADYSGRGELRSWLHATATRTALNILRARRRELRADDDQLLELPAAGDDPEVKLLRQRYATEFKAAFGEALASLTPRQRVLIKRHFVDGLSTDALGTLYRVHRVTALRWLTDTRELLAKRTQHALWRRLGMQRAEFESVVRMVRSQLDFSIREMLGAEGASGV